MKPRLIASAIVGVALVLGTSGCSLLATQATEIPYAAAEGTNVPDSSGPLDVRNALIVANEDGSEGNFVAAVVNDTDETWVLSLEFGAGGISKKIIVPPRTTKSLGTEETEPLLVRGVDALPGSTTPVSFQSGDGVTAVVAVPVLGGGLDYLAPLVP